MKKLSKKLQKKQDAFKRAFLVYNWMKKPQKEKDACNERAIPSIIANTMRLEGEWVSREDVVRILKDA